MTKHFFQIISDNRNDLIEDTFIYKLHEDKIFDFKKLNTLIENIELCCKYFKDNEHDANDENIIKSIIENLFWIFSSTYKSMIYHYNEKDLYEIIKFENGSENDTIKMIELLGNRINELCNILILKNYGKRGNCI